MSEDLTSIAVSATHPEWTALRRPFPPKPIAPNTDFNEADCSRARLASVALMPNSYWVKVFASCIAVNEPKTS